MVAVIIVLLLAAFILADVAVRLHLKRREAARLRREREAALDTGLRLQYTNEAPSLKRVTVDAPRARILAVDDEAVVLDSLRRILVLAGYSIDTVETGPEAVGLVQRADYDFVFTDLKMPDMDGVEVVKAVHHLRPDTDIVVITGYATVETAVETMKHGAVDYVQKPFTEEELTTFVNMALIRRQDRLDRAARPVVHLVTPSSGAQEDGHTFNLPAGVFLSAAHVWLCIEASGSTRLGIDDFVRQTLGPFDAIDLPPRGRAVAKGQPLFSLARGPNRVTVPAPIGGRVTDINFEAADCPELVFSSPYERGWICRVEPDNLSDDLPGLRIGTAAVNWYQQEIDRLMPLIGEPRAGHGDLDWGRFADTFLRA